MCIRGVESQMVSINHLALGSQREPQIRHPCNGATTLDVLRASVRACGRPARREARVSAGQTKAPHPGRTCEARERP